MALQRKNKFIAASIVALAAIVAIGYGAYKGKTKIESPSETLAKAGKLTETTVSGTAAASTVDDKDLIPIRTSTRKSCTLAPLLVADKGGFFKAEGLKLVFTGELGTGQLLPSILNGNNDFGDSHPNNLAASVAGGAAVKAVARSIIEPGPEIDPKYRHMRWYVDPKTGVKSFADLKNYKAGKNLTINGTLNSCSSFLPSVIADKAGLSRNRFEFVTMSKEIEAIQAVSQGNLDIVGVHPTFFRTAEDAKLQLIGDSSETGLGEAAGLYVYYFSDDYIKKNPETIKKFVRAIAKAQNWANQHPDQTAQWTAEFIEVPVEGNHYYSATTIIDEAQWIPWLKDMEDTGVIEKGKYKPSDFLTHEFEQGF